MLPLHSKRNELSYRNEAARPQPRKGAGEKHETSGGEAGKKEGEQTSHKSTKAQRKEESAERSLGPGVRKPGPRRRHHRRVSPGARFAPIRAKDPDRPQSVGEAPLVIVKPPSVAFQPYSPPRGGNSG